MTARCLAFALLLAGCGPTGPASPVQRIEIRQSGWESLDVAISRTGQASFEKSEPGPQPRAGAFRISSQDFDKLEARLAEFRRQAVPRTDASIQEMLRRQCPDGVPYTTDRGAVYLRWVGPDFDQHYLADLGCDSERNADRNAKLLAIVSGFPLPKTLSK